MQGTVHQGAPLVLDRALLDTATSVHSSTNVRRWKFCILANADLQYCESVCAAEIALDINSDRFHFLNDMQELLGGSTLRLPRKVEMPQLAMVAAPHVLLLLISAAHAAAAYAPYAAPEAHNKLESQTAGAPLAALAAADG